MKKIIELKISMIRILSISLIIIFAIVLGSCDNSTTQHSTDTSTTSAETSLTPPWTDIEVFHDELTAINVSVGDKFIIRYDYYHNLFPTFEETYENVILLEESGESTGETSSFDGTGWFLFQAVTEGNARITIKEFTHQSDTVQSQKEFELNVIEPLK